MIGTSPDTLALEADVFWVSVAGHNPVEFLKSYAGRIPMVHLKNKAEGMGVQFNETGFCEAPGGRSWCAGDERWARKRGGQAFGHWCAAIHSPQYHSE